LLASGSGDSTVKIWDATTGECIKTLSVNSYSVNSVSFNNQGLLAIGSSDSTVKIWDVTAGERNRPLNGHDNATTIST